MHFVKKTIERIWYTVYPISPVVTSCKTISYHIISYHNQNVTLIHSRYQTSRIPHDALFFPSFIFIMMLFYSYIYFHLFPPSPYLFSTSVFLSFQEFCINVIIQFWGISFFHSVVYIVYLHLNLDWPVLMLISAGG